MLNRNGLTLVGITTLIVLCARLSFAQSCDPHESCHHCLARLPDGQCLEFGDDIYCEARKRACALQVQPPVEAVVPRTRGFPGSSATEAPPAPVVRSRNTQPPRIVPVRGYMRARDIPPPWVSAYGVVAFRAKPTSDNRSRLLMVCQAYVASLPRRESIPSSVPDNEQMITIWPLDSPEALEAQADRYDFAVDHYDLYGGQAAIRDAQEQGATLDGRGPFLIGWSPSATRGVSGKVVLTIDLSGFDSQASFDEMFQIWQQKIIENPALWSSGFSMESVRLTFRDFLDRYGSPIVEAIRFTTR